MPAWVARGEAFLSMGSPLLAGLHFDRALEIDDACADALSLKDKLRLTFADPSRGRASYRDAPESAAHRASLISAPPTGSPVASHASREEHRGEGSAVVVVSSSGNAGAAAAAGDAEGEEGGKGGVGGTEAAGEGGVEGGRGLDGGGGGTEETEADSALPCYGAAARGDVGVAVAAACEQYRAGMVLHQEGFLSSSNRKFRQVLILIQEVEEAVAAAAAVSGGGVGAAAAAGAAAGAATGAAAGVGVAAEVAVSRNADRDEKQVTPDGVRIGRNGGGEGGGVDREGVRKVAGVVVAGELSAVEASPAAACVWSSSSCVRAMKSMRVGCHLNIAAAFLLRKKDYECAVDHCTR